MVLKINLAIFKSAKCFGKIIVQYNIWETGNRKLIKNTDEQIKKAIKDLWPFKEIIDFDLNPPFVKEWYWAFFRDRFSIINSPRIKIKRKKDSWLA